MAVTMQNVKSVLDPEEPDYDFATLLGPGALPHLETLVRGKDPMLASKAAYLAGLIAGEGSASVVSQASHSDNAAVRVAAAAAARHLDASGASDVLLSLLGDSDAGVRRVALTSVPDSPTGDLLAMVEDIHASESDDAVREVSSEVLRRVSAASGGPDAAVAGKGSGEMPGRASGQGEMPGSASDQGEMPGLGAGQGEMPGSASDQGEMPGLGGGQGDMPGVGGAHEMPPLGGGHGDMPGLGGGSSGEMPPL